MTRRSELTNKTIVAMVVSALIAGLAAYPLLNRPAPPPEPLVLPADPAALGPGPWRVEDGIPTGFSHDEAGALAAAGTYATTGQALIDMAPTELADAVRRYSAAGSESDQISEVTTEVASLRHALSSGQGRIQYVKSVLATRLSSYSPERAEIQVWAVGVLWRQGAAEPQADWTTSTFVLVWEDDTWKVETESITSGPAPAPNGGTPPVSATELDRLLEGFDTWGTTR